jgi:tetratricopeptide (TPR) repeat protein
MENSVTPRRRNRLLLPLLIVGLPLIGLAYYVRTAPARAERALRSASYDQLVEAVKQDPGNPRILYYFGLRNRDLGRLGPARAALAHASELDPDSEEIAFARADLESQAGSDQEAFQVLRSVLKRHPQSAEAHRNLALFYAAHNDSGNAYQEAMVVTSTRPLDVKAWRLAGVQALASRNSALAEAALRHAVALDPRDWRSQFGLGTALVDQAQHREALTAFKAAAALAPEEPLVLARVGREQLELAVGASDLKTAIETLTPVVEKHPDIALAQLSLGQAQLRAGDYVAAQRSLLAAERNEAALADLRPNLHASLRQLYIKLNDRANMVREARMLQAARTYEQQLDWLRSRLITGSLDQATCLKFARICADHGDITEAVRLYRRLLGDPANAELARSKLTELTHNAVIADTAYRMATASVPVGDLTAPLRDAEALFKSKQYTRAIDAYKSILGKSPDIALAWQGLGQSYRALGQNASAFSALNQAVKLDPDLPDAQFQLAALYYDSGLPDEAARRLKPLIQRPQPKAEYFNALGDCQRDDPLTYGQAEENYRRAALLDPHQPDYLVNLADAETLNNKLQAAEMHYRQALQAAPTSAHAQLALGQFLLRQQNTPERRSEAEQLLRGVLAQQPNSSRALLTLGRLLTERGNARDAVPFLESAVELAPNQQDGWYNLARAYTRLGNRDRSQYCYAAFRRLSSLNDALDKTIELLHAHPKSAPAHLKLARLYVQAGVNTKALNQYEVYLALNPRDSAASAERQRFADRLRASGRMPDISHFDRMVAAAVQFHE